MKIYHDSRDEHYRSPGGSQPCGSEIIIRLATSKFCDVQLRLWNGSEKKIPMRRLGYSGAMLFHEVNITLPENPCLLWYWFECQTNSKIIFYGNNKSRLGGVGEAYSHEPPAYQITVHSRDYQVPEWLRNGIMYQIMPDRFYNGDTSGELLNARSDVRLHGDWYERPDPVVAPYPRATTATDFFGGNLIGIQKKLDYLCELGVTVIYLTPVFKAFTNHKYDVGDYTQIDPMFGTNQEFTRLCDAAREKGIRIILDGVFSHVGDDSIYFNKYGTYNSVGAYQSKASPYYKWFKFDEYPDKYKAWWGVESLPEINEDEKGFVDMIIHSPDAISALWLARGAAGWRLDVADELPMDFLREFRKRVKRQDERSVIIGEVWEDASNKISYGQHRSYTLGDTLDSAMNYPLRSALIEFIMQEISAADVQARILALYERYPKAFSYSLMNLLGSHDRKRIATRLGGGDTGLRRARLMLAAIIALPGMPAVYYGDEAGMFGQTDPDNRAAYPWGKENSEQLAAFKSLLNMRASSQALKTGDCKISVPHSDVIIITREISEDCDVFGQPAQNQRISVMLNRAHRPVRIIYDGQQIVIPGQGYVVR